MRGAAFGKRSHNQKNFRCSYPRISVGEENTKGKNIPKQGHQKNECGPGQPPGPHCSRISCLAFPPQGGGDDASGPTALASERRICRSRLQIVIRKSQTAITAVASGPVLLDERDGGGGRNAQATSTRLRAFSGMSSGNSPSRITGNRWLCRKSSSNLGNLTLSLPDTLRQSASPRNRKTTLPCAETVDDGTSLWKAEEN